MAAFSQLGTGFKTNSPGYFDSKPTPYKKGRKSNLQKDYEAITDFNGDWVKPLMSKYNLTREEVLNNIRL
jgi:Mor family transcriptional regulator